jgi:hypothetical protein
VSVCGVCAFCDDVCGSVRLQRALPWLSLSRNIDSSNDQTPPCCVLDRMCGADKHRVCAREPVGGHTSKLLHGLVFGCDTCVYVDVSSSADLHCQLVSMCGHNQIAPSPHALDCLRAELNRVLPCSRTPPAHRSDLDHLATCLCARSEKTNQKPSMHSSTSTDRRCGALACALARIVANHRSLSQSLNELGRVHVVV